MLRSAPPDVFISYARADGEEFAHTLQKELEGEKIRTWLDRFGMSSGQDWWKQITEALDQVEYLVLVATPNAMKSHVVQDEWNYARRRGVCIFPVLVPGTPIDFEQLPRWMKKVHFYDLDHQRDKFINDLKTRCTRVRVPFMVPDLPTNYIDRGERNQKLKDRFLLDGDPAFANIVVTGSGGFGKSTQAIALCHDEDIRTAFSDGILWVQLGSNPDVLANLTTLYAHLTDERPSFVDEEDAAIKIAEKMEGRDLLLVIDDVWQFAHVRPFLRGGEHCARLITSRDAQIAFDLDAEIFEISGMNENEAIQLFASRLGVTEHDSRLFTGLVEKLGDWPLLLDLASAALNRYLKHGRDLRNAISRVEAALQKKGVSAFDSPKASITKTIEVSLDLLDDNQKQNYTELVIFPVDVQIPISVIQSLWRLDMHDTEELIDRLSELSLVNCQNVNGSTFVRLHNLVHLHLKSQVGDASTLHRRLLDQANNPYQLSTQYMWRWYFYHIEKAQRKEQIHSLLTDFRWLYAKLRATDIASVIRDFDYVQEQEAFRLIRDAISLSAHVVSRDPEQFAGQLLGRLLNFDVEPIRALIQTTETWTRSVWLCPQISQLTAPGSGLIRTIEEHRDAISKVTIVDDAIGFSASSDGTVRMWDAETGISERVFGRHEGVVAGFALNTDHTTLYTLTTNGYVYAWEVNSGELKTQLHLQDGALSTNSLALSSDNRYLAVAAGVRLGKPDQNVVCLIDLQTLTPRFLRGHTNRVADVAWLPNENIFVSVGDDRKLLQWDINSGKHSRLLQHSHRLTTVSINYAGNAIAIGTVTGSVIYLDRINEQSRLIEAHQDQVTGIEFLEDKLITVSKDGYCNIWELDSFENVLRIRAHSTGINAIVATQTDSTRRLFTGADDGSIKLWSIDQEIQGQNSSHHSAAVTRIRFREDSRLVLSSSQDRSIRQFNLDGDMEEVNKIDRHQGQVIDVDTYGEDRFLVSLVTDRTGEGFVSRIRVWDATNNVDVRTIVGPSKPLTNLQILPNSSVAVTSDGYPVLETTDYMVFSPRIRLWNLETGVEIFSFEGHQNGVSDFDLHPNEQDIVSASFDGSAKVWSLTKREFIRNLVEVDQRLTAIRCFPNGTLVAIGLEDGGLQVIDYLSGELRASFREHTKSVLSIDVSLDNRFIVSSGGDHRICLLDIDEAVNIATFTAEAPVTSCILSTGRKVIVAGDLRGGLHLLRIEQTESPIPRLLSIFSSGSGFAREAAIRALAATDTEETQQALIDAMRDEDAMIRRAAILGLGRTQQELPELMIDLVTSALKDKDSGVQIAAIQTLGKLKVRNASSILVSRLTDEDPKIVREAVVSLGYIGASESVSELLELLETDISDDITLAIVNALLLLKDPQSLGRIVGLLESENRFIREASVRAIGQIGSEAETHKLHHMLSDSVRYVRISAYEALENLDWQPTEADKLLYYIDTRQWSLCTIMGSMAVPYLLEVLTDESLYSHERINVVKALEKIADTSVVPPLLEMLRRYDDDFRQIIIHCLGVIGDTRSLIRLWDLYYQSSKPGIRKAADEAISKIHARHLPHGNLDKKTNDALIAFLEAETWSDKRKVIEQNTDELLSTGVDIMLKASRAKAQAQKDEHGLAYYHTHLALLQSISSSSIDSVFERIESDQIAVPAYTTQPTKQTVGLQSAELLTESLDIRPEIVKSATDFMLSKSWDEARQVFEANRQWLTLPEAETYFSLGANLFARRGEMSIASTFQTHLEVLRRAKREGSQFTFTVIQQDEVDPVVARLVSQFWSKPLDSAIEYLERYQDQLFRIDADVYLEREIHRANITGNRLKATSMHLALFLLREAREKDIATAYRERQRIQRTVDQYLVMAARHGLSNELVEFVNENRDWLFRSDTDVLLAYMAARARGAGAEENGEIIDALKGALNTLRQGSHGHTTDQSSYVSLNEIKRAIQELLRARDWKHARQIALARQTALSQPEVNILMDRMIDEALAENNQRSVDNLRFHQSLITQCRNIGIDEAFDQLEMKIDTERFNRLFAAAKEYLVNNDFELAEQYVLHAMQLRPQEPDLVELAAEVALKNGNPQAALGHLTKLIENNTVNAEVFYSRAQINWGLGHMSTAIEDMNQAIRLQPSRVDYYVTRGSYLANSNHHRSALTDLDYALDLAQDIPFSAQIARVRSQIALGDSDGIQQQLDTLDPTGENLEVRLLQAMLHISNGDDASALNTLEGIDTTSAILMRAKIHMSFGETSAALTQLSEAISKEPENDKLYFQRGQLHLFAGDYRSARKDLNQAILLNRHFGDYYLWRSLTYLLLDNLSLAYKDIQQTNDKSTFDSESIYIDFWKHYVDVLRSESGFDSGIELDEETSSKCQMTRLALRIDYIEGRASEEEIEISLNECASHETEYEKLYFAIIKNTLPDFENRVTNQQETEVASTSPQKVTPEIPQHSPVTNDNQATMQSNRLFFLFEQVMLNAEQRDKNVSLFKTQSDLALTDELLLLIRHDRYRRESNGEDVSYHDWLIELIEAAKLTGIDEAFAQVQSNNIFNVIPFSKELIDRTIRALSGSPMDRMQHAQYVQKQAEVAQDPDDIAFIQSIQMSLFGEDPQTLIDNLSDVYQAVWHYVIERVT